MNNHFPSVRTYLAVWIALLALTGLTVAISRVELGELNVVAAITIAAIKATLVTLFFMNVKRSSSLTKLFVGAGLFWLFILIGFIMSDYHTRSWQVPGHWWGA
jgi:cytochrome c oxidase subunit 4